MYNKKIRWWQIALLVACAGGLIFGAYQVAQVGNRLQYVIQPPDQSRAENEAPNAPIARWQKQLDEVAEEWQTTMEAWSLGGVVERAGIAAGDSSASARLTLMGERGLQVQPQYLRYGRLFYEEELAAGTKVALLDEQLALALFRQTDGVDRVVQIGGEAYQVIGILRHQKQVGDLMDYGAYIPLNSVVEGSLSLDALVVEAIPKTGMGASTSFSAVCGMWQQGGTLIDLGKESMSATLWLRALLFLVGMTCALRLVSWLNHCVRRRIAAFRQLLQVRYAASLWPRMAGVTLAFLMGYGLAGGLIALLMDFIIQPVYTFPEWVPAVLVEWQDIADAFWKVWQLPATMMELRTPELLRLRYFTLLIQGCSAACGVLLAVMDGKKKENRASCANEYHNETTQGGPHDHPSRHDQ